MAHNFFQGTLHLRIAFISAGVGKADHCAFADFNNIAKFSGRHKDDLIIIAFDKRSYFAVAFAQPFSRQVELLHNKLVIVHILILSAAKNTIE